MGAEPSALAQGIGGKVVMAPTGDEPTVRGCTLPRTLLLRQSQQFLTARRLVEAGVGCVTLSVGGVEDGTNWDTHNENFPTLRRLLPELERRL